MKKKDFYFVSAILFFSFVLIIAFTGCGGGAKTHDISTDSNGVVFGVMSSPSDGSIEIDIDDDILISWPLKDFPPPASFTFKMFQETNPGDFSGVYTELKDNTDEDTKRSWRFAPVSSLSSNTWHKITLTDNKDYKEVIMFRTDETYGAASKTKAAHSERKGSIEHFIQVR